MRIYLVLIPFVFCGAVVTTGTKYIWLEAVVNEIVIGLS